MQAQPATWLFVQATERSAGWILTEYRNQSSPATFYSVGAAVSLD